MPRQLGRVARPSSARQVAPQALRSSPRLRGYDSKWDRLSRRLRREVGICQRCEPLGRVRLCTVVDHKHPVADGGEKFARANLWCLCDDCHGWKASLEAYARQTDQVDRLPFWCDQPEHLPARFKEVSACRARPS